MFEDVSITVFVDVVNILTIQYLQFQRSLQKVLSPVKSNGKPGTAKTVKKAEGGWADETAPRAPTAL